MTTNEPTTNEPSRDAAAGCLPITEEELTRLAGQIYSSIGQHPDLGSRAPTDAFPSAPTPCAATSEAPVGGFPLAPTAAGFDIPPVPEPAGAGSPPTFGTPGVLGLPALRPVPGLAPSASSARVPGERAGIRAADRRSAAASSPTPGFFAHRLDFAALPFLGRVGAPWGPALPHTGAQPDPPAAAATARQGFHFVGEPDRFARPDLGVVPAGGHQVFDVQTLRRDFPILAERVNGRPLVWFDNAATTQKPQVVIDRLGYFYAHENSNIHRGAHELAARATDAYEDARGTVRRFIGAGQDCEIVFVRGATEAINLVAQSWGRTHLGEGDEILITHLEHHANIVPWQMLAQQSGAVLKVAPVDDRGNLLLEGFTDLLGPRTKLVAVTHVSNALGTVTPIRQIVELGHRAGARVLVDGAQSVPHIPIDVRALGADFFVFSGHKVFGPTGIGVLYGTEEVLAQTPPWQGGGNMIADVTLERSIYQVPPNKFEAGTGNIADAVGLGEALRYVERVGIDRIAAYEHALLDYATPRLAEIPGLALVGTAEHKASVLSFVLAGHDEIEVGKALNREGIAVRAGHHCAQPILRRLGLEQTVRASLAFYNTHQEVDVLVDAVRRIASSPGGAGSARPGPRASAQC
jgi:cysteine desulfurase/selenocysteine lyase